MNYQAPIKDMLFVMQASSNEGRVITAVGM